MTTKQRLLPRRDITGLRYLGTDRSKGIGPHVSPDDRELLTLETGVTWQRLGQVPRHHVDFLLVTYQPGSASSAEGRLMRHSGTGVRLFDQRRTEADPGLR